MVKVARKRLVQMGWHFPGHFRSKSFGIKLFATFTVLLIVIAMAFSVIFIFQQTRLLSNDLIEKGNLLTEVLAYNSRLGVFSENANLLTDPIRGTLDQEGVLRVRVYSGRGRLLQVQITPGCRLFAESVG